MLNIREKPLTATLEYMEMQLSEDFPKFTKDEIKRSDEIAMNHLMITKRTLLKNRKNVERLQSVYYKEASRDGGALLVCTDGSMLFAAGFVSKDSHFLAFENGFRTKPSLLIERKTINVE
jgi:hypothetical protein